MIILKIILVWFVIAIIMNLVAQSDRTREIAIAVLLFPVFIWAGLIDLWRWMKK